MPDIWIRTDGNEKIATGHLMRCLSIARACADQKKCVIFLTADAQSETLLRERFAFPSEFEIKCLHSDYQDMEKELPSIENIMQKNQTSSGHTLHESDCWILVDSYYVTASYLEALKNWGQVAYLDDLAAFSYPVDCIINYDMLETEKPNCYNKANRCLLGSAYTPLRAQFQNVPYTVRQNAEHILLSTGGTDPFQVLEKLLDRFMKRSNIKTESRYLPNSDVPNYQYHIVTSRLNSRYDTLIALSSRYPNIHIHENVQDMAGLMAQCDLAVSAGGTTLYELCAVGVPTISLSFTDNQLNAVQNFAAQNIIPYAGDVRRDIDEVLNTICRFLNEKENTYSKRLEHSNRMRLFIDGHGAARIVEALG